MTATIDYAGFGDRLWADIADGLFGLLVALPVWLFIDRGAFGRQGAFLNDDGPFGATDAVLWLWFFWNLTYLVGKSGQSWVVGGLGFASSGKTARQSGSGVHSGETSSPA